MKQNINKKDESSHVLEAKESWQNWKEISLSEATRRTLKKLRLDEGKVKTSKDTKKHEPKIDNLLSQDYGIKDDTMVSILSIPYNLRKTYK